MVLVIACSSQGETDSVDVPQLVGETADYASGLVAGSGLEVVVEITLTNDAPPGEVISQNPPAGSAVEPGTVVQLTEAAPVPATTTSTMVPTTTEPTYLHTCPSGEEVSFRRSEYPDEADRTSALCSYWPPLIVVSCPPDSPVLPWGRELQVSFGYEFTPGSNKVVAWTADYGDGRTYSSVSWDDAVQNLFWHVYSGPGRYVANFSVEDDAGTIVSADCRHAHYWSDPPATTTRPPVDVDLDCLIGGPLSPACND
jgi:hypothetical protein